MSEEEIVNVDATKESELNQKTRLLQSMTVDAMGFFRKNDPLVEAKKSNNSFNLSSEARPFKTEKDHTSLNGNPSSIKTAKSSFITKDANIRGLEFVGSVEDDAVVQAVVNSPATAMFIGCTFRRPASGSGTHMVQVDSGAFAIFVGCKFIDGTFPISNSAAAAACIIVGCSRAGNSSGDYDGASDANVTLVGSL